MKTLTIGSRGSKLALTQTHWIAEQIQSLHPGIPVEVQIIKTTGDKMSAASLTQLAGESKGLFVKEIEEALLAGSIDLAVHSLKDVPSTLPEGLTIGVIPKREDPRDALIGNQQLASLSDLEQGATIGTSSLRRSVQLRGSRPDFKVVPIRGNVDTRLRKLKEQQLSGVILALAGLRRMKLEQHVSYVFSVEEMVPAVGQGALGIEIRSDDERVMNLIGALEHQPTRTAVEAEREFLRGMGGGCQVPMGAFVELSEPQSRFLAFLANPSGDQVIRYSTEVSSASLTEEAERAVDYFRSQGSDKILAEVDVL
jgi:hydroxymethylbilane synthase